MSGPRILVAGIGNIFFGDDAFGVEVVRRLAGRPQPEGVRVVDFGIRGFDLACALLDGCDLAILVDATPRDGPPGTLYVIEPEAPQGPGEPAGMHGLDPQRVLALVRALGGEPPPLRLVGCEPSSLGSLEEPAMGLSEPVAAAVGEAVVRIEGLIEEMRTGLRQPQKGGTP